MILVRKASEIRQAIGTYGLPRPQFEVIVRGVYAVGEFGGVFLVIIKGSYT